MSAPSVPYVLFDDPADICARANQLVRLVQSGPAGTSSLGSGWWDGVLGPALLAKAAGTLASMILLLPAHGMVDAMTLLRALYEGTVQLSWVAIDPDAHLPRWYATSSYWEWREHCYWEKAGRGLRSPQEAEELKKDGGTREDRLPGVPTMAAEADEHWGTLVPGWSPTSNADDPGLFSSMRGLYGYIYQRGSAATHARARGLDPFMSEVSGRRPSMPKRRRATTTSMPWACTRLPSRSRPPSRALAGRPGMKLRGFSAERQKSSADRQLPEGLPPESYSDVAGHGGCDDITSDHATGCDVICPAVCCGS
jgi:Family of unknown function (DUF5677)